MLAILLMTAVADVPGDMVRMQLAEATRRGYVAALRLLGTPDESREACQEAAARALHAAERYDPHQPFYPWFYRILRNHCIDRLRERRKLTDEEPTGQVDCSAESMLVQGERERAVSEAIQTLPLELREVIELRHFQDATYEEMALIMGYPVGTVMSRLY